MLHTQMRRITRGSSTSPVKAKDTVFDGCFSGSLNKCCKNTNMFLDYHSCSHNKYCKRTKTKENMCFSNIFAKEKESTLYKSLSFLMHCQFMTKWSTVTSSVCCPVSLLQNKSFSTSQKQQQQQPQQQPKPRL